MTRYAERTKVPVSQSKTEIERILARYGADQFIYGIRDGTALVAFRAHERHVKFVLPLPDDGDEREERRRWRCLALVFKSKLLERRGIHAEALRRSTPATHPGCSPRPLLTARSRHIP